MIFDRLWPNRNSHRTDADLMSEIYEAFRGYAPLYATKPRIEVEVADGAVILQGVVRGGGQRGMAEKLAAEVEGVKSVRNELLDDPTIQGAVARALAGVRLSTTVIRIKSYHGVVTLSGPVSSQAQQMAAEAITCSIPGVVDVINRLVVSSERNGYAR